MSSYRTADATVASYRAAAITPSDSATIEVTRGVYVGVAGNVAVTMSEGGNVTFVGVPAGTFMPIQVVKVLATGTSAASMVAMY